MTFETVAEARLGLVAEWTKGGTGGLDFDSSSDLIGRCASGFGEDIAFRKDGGFGEDGC